MTEQIPKHALLLDDDGSPLGIIDTGKMQSDAIEMAYEMAVHCGDEDALDAVSSKWLDRVGPEGFGYVAAAALRMMTHYILDPTLQAVDLLAPEMKFRDRLDEAFQKAREVQP